MRKTKNNTFLDKYFLLFNSTKYNCENCNI